MESFVQYLVGVAVPLTVALVIAIARWVRRTMSMLDEVHGLAVSVDSAVNHRPSTDPKIYDLVKEAAVQATKNGETAERLESQFADHTRSDEINFADLRSRLAAMPQNQ